jgi:endonuclease YncB( thermonuclease family)
MIIVSPPAFVCTVTRVHDGDGPLCRKRRAGYVCSDRAARASQRTVSALVLRRRLSCQALEPSYSRIVARCRLPDGRDLSCAVIAAGAAMRWGRYWRRYGMGECG